MTAASAEFQLCLQCCRWAFAGGDSGAIQAQCATVEWSRFTRLVRFHRVQGLVWNCLWSTQAPVPAEVAQALSADARAIIATNLQIAAEGRDMRSDFESAGISLLFVKGLTVAALAYPKPLLKMGWDIDVLIDRAQLADAAGLLRARGYRQVIPPPPTELANWHQRRKESVWSRNSELHVEVHTRLADNRHLIPGIDVRSTRREVEVCSGITLPTLERDELFAYLCVHGASSAWFRLKWITDLAALLHACDDIDRLYERSQQLGAHRAAAQALLLADELYGTLAGSNLKQHLLHDSRNRLLAAAALNQIVGNNEARDPASSRLGTWRIHLTQLLLKPGLGFKIDELARQTADILF